MIKAAVIGDPISHSLSPIIHNYFLEKFKINGSYQAIKIAKEDLKLEVSNLVNQGYAGFNVTIPHKEEIYKLCNYKSKSAQITKAVNTALITPDGKLFGHNSDVDGFLNNLKKSQINFSLKDKTAFVIGAGGAARAIIYALIKENVREIFLTNRNEKRAQNLIADFSDFNIKINFCEMPHFEKNLINCDLLINATSLGMQGQEQLEINLNSIKKSAIIYDIVYKPLMTNLLLAAQKNKNNVVTGIGMLVEQALIGFELWFKEKPQDTAQITKILLEKL
jgi:shikimate dehydrogenase